MKRVCVFCGSRPGRNPAYAEAAKALGHSMAERGIALVYGGGHVGLMGIIADAVLGAGGQVMGVIPEFLEARELAHTNLTELIVVPSMHARKAKMAELSDGFIAMPGGFGTFEEICEVLTWGQLGLHIKPHGLLNVAGYYDPLIRLFDQAVTEDFLSIQNRGMVLENHDPVQLLEMLIAWQLPHQPSPPEERDILERF